MSLAIPAVPDTAERWRVGRNVKLNVYCGDRPVCQCHNEADAANIVQAMNVVVDAFRFVLGKTL